MLHPPLTPTTSTTTLLGMTDWVQPVDHHCGAQIKKVMQALYKVEVQVNFKEWRSFQANGSLSRRNRRLHMANWLTIAWIYLQQHPQMIEDSFKHTILVKLDGSHELKYRGLDTYNPPSM